MTRSNFFSSARHSLISILFFVGGCQGTNPVEMVVGGVKGEASKWVKIFKGTADENDAAPKKTTNSTKHLSPYENPLVINRKLLLLGKKEAPIVKAKNAIGIEELKDKKSKEKKLFIGDTKIPTDKWLCRMASTFLNGVPGWENSQSTFKKYIDQVKRRGKTAEDCAILLGRLPPNSVQKSKILTVSGDLSLIQKMPVKQLCHVASVPKNAPLPAWDKSKPNYIQYIDEAKRLGLSPEDCAILLGRSPLKNVVPTNLKSASPALKSNHNVNQAFTKAQNNKKITYKNKSAKLLDDQRLCEYSTEKKKGLIIEWQNQFFFRAHVDEAKRRGLTLNKCYNLLNKKASINKRQANIETLKHTDNPPTGSASVVNSNAATLRKTKLCIQCALNDAELSGLDLQKAQLIKSNLQGADLRRANLRGAQLSQANFWRTNLENADLQNANFKDAILVQTNFKGANLKNANFQGAELRFVNFEGANLDGVNFKTAKLFGVDINSLKRTKLVKVAKVSSPKGTVTNNKNSEFFKAIRSAIKLPKNSGKTTNDDEEKVARLLPQDQILPTPKLRKSEGSILSVLRLEQGGATAISATSGNNLLAGFKGGHLALIDLRSGSEIRQFDGHTSTVHTITTRPGLGILASGDNDGNIRLWEIKSGSSVGLLKGHTGKITSLTFTANGKLLLSGSADASVNVWEVSSKKKITSYQGHMGEIGAIVTLPGKTVAASASTRAKDKSLIRLWDYKTGIPVGNLRGHRGPVFALIASNDGSKIISGSRDKSIKVWDMKNKKSAQTFGIIDGHRGAVRSLVMSMDGRFIYSGSDDKSIIVWNSKTGDIVAKVSGHKGKVLELKLAHDGKRIISNSNDKRVRTWDLHKNKGTIADLKQ